MMMRGLMLASAVLGSGCGRLGFEAAGDARSADQDASPDVIDAVPCVPVGHDEDGDGIDDACDVCPQLAGSQVDTDGDGIGDDCDLAPTRQVRVLFDPKTTPRAEWNYSSQVQFTGDAVRYPAVTGGIGSSLVRPPSRDVFEMVGTVGTSPSVERQLSLQISDGTGTYYCEIYDAGGAATEVQLTYTLDEVTYVNVAGAPVAERLENGNFRLIFDHDPPNARCIAEWNGTRTEIAGLVPSTISADVAYLSVFQLDASVTSFVHLVTPP